MKLINYLLTKLLGKKEEFDFDEKLVISYNFYATIICFLSIFGNEGLSLNNYSILIVSISFIVYLLIFITVRFYRKILVAKWLLSFYTLVFCNFYWLANYGSRGSAMYVLLVYYSFLIYIWDNKNIRLFTILVLVNISILFGIELLNPNFIPVYPSENSRIIDTYIGLFIFLGVLATLALSAKNNYIEQYRKAQRSDQLKSAFLANMSHEIRTPLNAIMGFSELLAKRELTQEKKDQYSFLIKDNGKYLMKLVSDILDISLLESGQLTIDIQKVSLNELMDKLYQNFYQTMKLMKKKDINLILNIPPLSLIIESDALRIEQIIINLVSNAIKFTQEGYIIFGYQKKGDIVLFYIEDTGRGIKEELKPEIFNRFVKNEEKYDNKYERGAGIGLSLSKELAQILNGEIWFTSEYLKGSTFYFSLPIHMTSLNNENS